MPARDHAVVRHRGQGDRDACREGGHVAGHEPEQLKLPGDQQASPDEHGVRHDHPQPHRNPPQVLRLGVLRPKHNEGQDERDVGGVEDVPSLPADEVLRGHGEGDDADEDVNPVLAPPLAVYRAWDPEDEGGAVPGQQPAGRPHDDLVLEESHSELDQRTCGEADQDLGHREPEIQDRLPEDLEGQEDRRHVESGIPDARQQDRVLPPPDPNAPAPGARPARRLAGYAQPARRRRVGGRHGRVTVMVSGPLHGQAAVRIQIRLLAAAGLGFALAACDPTLGLGLPSERVLEDGAATTLTQPTGFDIKVTYSTSAGELWAIDVQLVRPNTERATASTGDQKVEAIILGETAYFRGQKFLAARMGSDPLSQNLVKAAGSSWWKGSPSFIPPMKGFTDG